MSPKIAVAFIHGIEIDDPDYAVTAIARLKARFARHAPPGTDAGQALEIKAIYWSDVVATAEKDLLYAVMGSTRSGFFGWLRWLVTRINAGNQVALVPFGLAALARILPRVTALHYPALRWVITDFVGDAIAYQITPGDRRLYDEIHAKVADTLHALAIDAGADAPLCVIAHSLGTVIASNYLYDLQAERGWHDGDGARSPRKLVHSVVRDHMGATPLERCETLAHFYTLGSPLALWALRYAGFGRPIKVPSPGLAAHHKGLGGEWINFYDRDDLVAYPLKGLSDAYEQAVTRDLEVSLRGLLVSWNPLVHPWYWNDDRVIDPIARALAGTWEQLTRQPAAGAVAMRGAEREARA